MKIRSDRGIVRARVGTVAVGLVMGLTLLSVAPASAQAPGVKPPVVRSFDLSGPRLGITSLSPDLVDKLADRGFEVRPLISQFGWQFERQFYDKGTGVTAVTEWVALLGGLDQNVVLPSLSWLVGLRTREGAEFGVGPNITPAGVSLALAAGVTFRAGAFNIPMNVAFVPSKQGARLSVLTGFTMRRRP